MVKAYNIFRIFYFIRDGNFFDVKITLMKLAILYSFRARLTSLTWLLLIKATVRKSFFCQKSNLSFSSGKKWIVALFWWFNLGIRSCDILWKSEQSLDSPFLRLSHENEPFVGRLSKYWSLLLLIVWLRNPGNNTAVFAWLWIQTTNCIAACRFRISATNPSMAGTCLLVPQSKIEYPNKCHYSHSMASSHE